MANNPNGRQGAAVPAQTVQAVDYTTFKNRITESVMRKITDLQKHGGVTVPTGYSAANQIYLAFLKLSTMVDQKTSQLILPQVTPQSVANTLLTMCIKGLSLDKNQCAFIKRGNELTLQVQYQGNMMMAKRYGADDPQAQVIYEGDDFEFEINPKTGKKVVTKHVQKLENIDNSSNGEKIRGAWCLVPYRDHPEKDPKVEIMTMAEIRQAWLQGATNGQSPAHKNFPQEMAKRTVINRACKLFIQTAEDAGVYADDAPEFQEQPEGAAAPAAGFSGLPASAPTEQAVRAAIASGGESAEAVDEQTGEIRTEPAAAPAREPEPVPVAPAPEPGPDAMQGTLGADFFTA